MSNLNLATEISLLLSKYENIKDHNELIFLLKKEFNKAYSKEDILNYYIPMTELEIENRFIEKYGYFHKYRAISTD